MNTFHRSSRYVKSTADQEKKLLDTTRLFVYLFLYGYGLYILFNYQHISDM